MNKTELKNFAVSARRDLLEKVALRAKTFGIDAKNDLIIEEQFGQLVINGNTYPMQMKTGFQSLANQLKTKGYEQLVEEVAYTWFNRIIAIRYMEVNDYLPERVNVLSSSTGKVEPDILLQFETMDLDVDEVAIKDLIRQGNTEQAFRKLFSAQCNVLNLILPFMFEEIRDYTELLLPDFLLDDESVIKKLVMSEVLTESFSEVEVIGWLYQFYNSEPKDKVFANLKKSKKIEKYDIPAATQLFTPKWIVQYMVENSLGQLWLEANPESSLKQSMRYYIEPAEQDEEVKHKLEEIRYQNVNLEEITIMDPCVGSGHILVYAFDLLYQMYEEAGYPSGDIPQLILEKNLYGLDIDDRAAQLASFALMMKAREKSRRIFRKKVELNVYSIQESNHLDKEGMAQLLGENDKEKEEIFSLIETFIDAKNFGSLLHPNTINYDHYLNRIEQLGEIQLSVDTYLAHSQMNKFKHLLEQAKILSSHYDVMVTNPPYMNSKGMNKNLTEYAQKNYFDYRSDLFAMYIKRYFLSTKVGGFNAYMTPMVWLFIKSYTQLREYIISEKSIQSLIQLHYDAFTAASVPICTFTFRNVDVDFKGEYIKLTDFYGEHVQPLKVQKALLNKEVDYRFTCNQNKFKSIPSSPIAYWTSDHVRELYRTNKKLGDVAYPRKGNSTSNNARFLRLWFEVERGHINFGAKKIIKEQTLVKRWFPYNKGGDYRKWYGNNEYIIDWKNDAEEIRKIPTAVIANYQYFMSPGLTWSTVSSRNFSLRKFEYGFIFDNGGCCLFFEEDNRDGYRNYILGLLNSIVFKHLFAQISPTLNFQSGDVAQFPIISPSQEIIDSVGKLSSDCVDISKNDWDSFETSWDFKEHPFITNRNSSTLLLDIFDHWTSYLVDVQFKKVKANEEEINQILIHLYGLQNELTSEVRDVEIKIRRPDRVRDTKSFLSYFIGCTTGRYSLDIEGLACAGGDGDHLKYQSFIPNKYGLIQLTDEHYFKDDIIARLREFLSVTFDAETVEENIQWLAESLELKRNETAEERLRRYFLDEFFKDHCQVYQKRPIYWLVDSGKQKGLRTLIYMHRYQPDTMATIRFEHLQEIQAKYNNEISAVDLRVVNPNLSATEKRDLEKRKTIYQKRLEELLEFDKKLAEYANAQISIDLDDGVKVNYAKFDKVLAKIK
ncbi:BREX-1 system adenine-specific DNA-methyltransferase PglX [Bacillus sp. V3B]|uniref:BREX-1 system adenine-specific DNA-methyltransferase PglX n=1 Tax=Bacillus sp. V3B TaxID=2804915 RepID=UPI00210DADAB|nr:BREX-1 system adenine-specific DNA-methyltransferase PglX [Bacillus sp. V3B]MCQ6274791.1 BREX-1 system adenine-specific DNA-methyltransferase PglX [Bacillus sp. V3B]